MKYYSLLIFLFLQICSTADAEYLSPQEICNYESIENLMREQYSIDGTAAGKHYNWISYFTNVDSSNNNEELRNFSKISEKYCECKGGTLIEPRARPVKHFPKDKKNIYDEFNDDSIIASLSSKHAQLIFMRDPDTWRDELINNVLGQSVCIDGYKVLFTSIIYSKHNFMSRSFVSKDAIGIPAYRLSYGITEYNNNLRWARFPMMGSQEAFLEYLYYLSVHENSIDSALNEYIDANKVIYDEFNARKETEYGLDEFKENIKKKLNQLLPTKKKTYYLRIDASISKYDIKKNGFLIDNQKTGNTCYTLFHKGMSQQIEIIVDISDFVVPERPEVATAVLTKLKSLNRKLFSIPMIVTFNVEKCEKSFNSIKVFGNIINGYVFNGLVSSVKEPVNELKHSPN